LPYGVEGFATPKHLIKEDGTSAKLEEKLSFKVIEFNKDAKRIIVSHRRIHEDEQRAAAAPTAEKREAIAKKGKKTANEEPVINAPVSPAYEKTTLGDIQQLADLKDQLSEAEHTQAVKAAEAHAKRVAKKAATPAPEADSEEKKAE
jgi:small subunit ribosomal protein S1